MAVSGVAAFVLGGAVAEPVIADSAIARAATPTNGAAIAPGGLSVRVPGGVGERGLGDGLARLLGLPPGMRPRAVRQATRDLSQELETATGAGRFILTDIVVKPIPDCHRAAGVGCSVPR